MISSNMNAYAPSVLPPGFGCGFGRSCPGSSGSTSASATPPPAAKWVRYTSPGTQQIYARLYNVLREPAVLGVKVIPEEQADTLAKQLVDTILAVPQSEDLRFNAMCAVEDIVLKPLVIFGTIVGLAGLGYGIYRVKQRRAAGG